MKHGEYELRELEGWAELQLCVALQIETWGADFDAIVPAAILGISQRLGGIAAGAFDRNHQLAGFVFGLTGLENGELIHWSDMLAVRAGLQNRGLGEALKQYQRAVLLERGVRKMYWTFDPLESRNAWLNFVRLGAIAREYRRDFYGDSASPLHAGIGTDRLIVEWQLDAPARSVATPGARRIEIPASIQQLKTSDPAAARAWRKRTRAQFESAFRDGYVVVGFERGAETGCYLLERAAFA